MGAAGAGLSLRPRPAVCWCLEGPQSRGSDRPWPQGWAGGDPRCSPSLPVCLLHVSPGVWRVCLRVSVGLCRG